MRLIVVKFVGACAVLVLALTACSGGHGRSEAPSTSSSAAATTTSTSARPGPLTIPVSYEDACAHEPAVCEAKTTGIVPGTLKRPLRFPIVHRGQHCPASSGVPVNNSFFVGLALGAGPVRPIPAAGGDLRHGIVELSKNTGAPGWLAFKTLWFSAPSYQGPIVIRAQRLDGPGVIAFGETPTLAPLVVPPGETLNSNAGYRTAPGGTWVKAPGCYAWQIDGLTFTDVIVVDAILRTP